MGMANEFTTTQQAVITHALGKQVDACGSMLGAVMDRPMIGHEGAQVSNASYWIRERLEAERTLIRARQVFWS